MKPKLRAKGQRRWWTAHAALFGAVFYGIGVAASYGIGVFSLLPVLPRRLLCVVAALIFLGVFVGSLFTFAAKQDGDDSDQAGA